MSEILITGTWFKPFIMCKAAVCVIKSNHIFNVWELTGLVVLPSLTWYCQLGTGLRCLLQSLQYLSILHYSLIYVYYIIYNLINAQVVQLDHNLWKKGIKERNKFGSTITLITLGNCTVLYFIRCLLPLHTNLEVNVSNIWNIFITPVLSVNVFSNGNAHNLFYKDYCFVKVTTRYFIVIYWVFIEYWAT